MSGWGAGYHCSPKAQTILARRGSTLPQPREGRASRGWYRGESARRRSARPDSGRRVLSARSGRFSPRAGGRRHRRSRRGRRRRLGGFVWITEMRCAWFKRCSTPPGPASWAPSLVGLSTHEGCSGVSGGGLICPVSEAAGSINRCEHHPYNPATVARRYRPLPSTGSAGTHGDPAAPLPWGSVSTRQLGRRSAVVASR